MYNDVSYICKVVEGESIMKKKLYKIGEGKKIDGVCGGIAEYFGVDATLIRLAWVIFCILGGSGILAYIIAAIIMPRKPEIVKENDVIEEK